MQSNQNVSNDFLLELLETWITQWDHPINFYHTLASGLVAMTANETLTESDAVRLERLKSFFLDLHHQQLGVMDKVKEMTGSASAC
ncbi:MAG: hypothetical protein IPN74_20200 [Haliscomenobacter sp.]|nr:hypothetical protein [Haliscomenobacter sp.]